MTQPTLYIIAGCNGAGKTTASVVVDLIKFNKIKELCQNKKK